jgi:hypothetical protein
VTLTSTAGVNLSACACEVILEGETMSARLFKDCGRTVTVFNPQGKPPSIPLVPMAYRTGTFAGRTVYFVDVRFMNGDVLLKEMEKVFSERFPGLKTEFRQKRGGYTEDDPGLWTEIREQRGVMVMAIGH